MGCLHDPANVQQTSNKYIQITRANAGRLLDRVNTLLGKREEKGKGEGIGEGKEKRDKEGKEEVKGEGKIKGSGR